jgi:diguanylate cyclase (GGDEF)-like protein
MDLVAPLVLGGLAVGAAALVRARAAREVDLAHARAAAASEEAERLGRRVRALQQEVELLSAIREVSLIANDDVSFERILGEVLKIVEDLVESSEVAIYLADEQAIDLAREEESAGRAPRPAAELLKPRVLRRAGETRFRDLDDEDRSLVDEAFCQRRTLRRIERGEVAVATLLFADAEIAGVLAVRASGAARGEEELCETERTLEALAKHVALAIKKPTLYDKAVVDALTRLFSKRHFVSQLARYCATSRRTGRALGLVLCDIDHFKKVNDTHGHLTGDIVLAEVAATIRETVREYDQAFRYGGEEMAILAPEATLDAARALAERVRAAIEARAFRTAKGEPLRVTASFGVAAFGAATAAPEPLIAAADAALYEAKHAGRNRVRAPGDPPAPPPPAPEAAPAAEAPKKKRASKRARTKAA